MLDQKALSDLIAQIYDAAHEPALWETVLRRIARSSGGQTAIFYEFDRRTNAADPIGSLEIDRDRMADYERHYSKVDVWNKRALLRPVGVAGSTQALVPDAEFERTEFYNDHLRPMGIFYGAGGVVDRTPDVMALVGVQRSRRAGPFGAETFGLFELVMPHLRRALRIRRELRRARISNGVLLEAVEQLAEGVVLVDGDARPAFMNAAAASLVDCGLVLRLEGERLAGPTASQTAALRRAIRRAAGGSCAAEPATVLLQGEVDAAPLQVTVTPLRSAGPTPGEPSIVLYVRDCGSQRLALDAARRRYGLTAAEGRLLAGIAAGKTLKMLAAEQRVSVNTLRVHLQHLFDKTGLHRQVDLVRLVQAPGVPEGPAVPAGSVDPGDLLATRDSMGRH